MIPLITVWSAGVIVLWAVLRANSFNDREVLLDPAHIAGLPWYTGLISNLGVLAWTLAAVAAAGAAHIAHLGGRSGAAHFLKQATVLGTLLALDDLLQLHSSVFPKMFGVSKTMVLGMYALLGLGWAITNRREILRTRWGLLVAAGIAMGGSIVVDQLFQDRTWSLLGEDGAKFLGVLAWATYFTFTARDIASSVVRELRTRATGATDAPPRQRREDLINT
jgi:hypothetical protein